MSTIPKIPISTVKAAILVLFLIAALAVVRFTPLREMLTAERIGPLLREAGWLAPLLFMGVYAAGVCLFVPGTVLTALGAALFGAYWGFVYVWLGAMVGASLAFLIGRYLGRDFAARLIGDRLQAYDERIERHGFATVLYLRLIYFPFTPMNFGMGLTRVRFWDYFWGTALGITVGTFLFTFFFGTLGAVWQSGRWGDLLSWRVFGSVALFIFSFFIPTLIKMIKGSASMPQR